MYNDGSIRFIAQNSTGSLYRPIYAHQFISNVATGTAPLTVTSTTKVTNLNADLLDGYTAGGSGGDWWTKVPVVAGDGVMEIGKYIDFHNTATDGTDFTYRIENSTNGTLVFSGIIDTTKVITDDLSVIGAGRVFGLESTSSTSDTGLILNTNASFTGVTCGVQNKRSASTAYSLEWWMSGDGTTAGTDIEFNHRGDGTAFADVSWNGGGADYAEYFEWLDGNQNEEDRRGYSVVLEGDKIRIAEEGEEPIGVISGNPSVVGDTAWNKWIYKYLSDDFGTYIMEPHNIVEWEEIVEKTAKVEAVYDENGNEISPEIEATYETISIMYEDWNIPEGVIIPDNATYKSHDENGNLFTHRKLNPEYDPNVEYIPREQRSEWDAVGLLGKLRIRKNQIKGSKWIKMRDISDTVEEWLVR
jgi:hypothetical protein